MPSAAGVIVNWSMTKPCPSSDASQSVKTGARAVGADARTFASSLSAPYCGVNAGFEAAQWLAEPAQVMSLALVPLRETGAGEAFGMLVLGSPDPTRYSADMGTDFLVRVGEIASAALARLLAPRAARAQ